MPPPAAASFPLAEHLPPPFALTLSEVAPGGDAVGRREDGLVVFVPGGTPGDQVLVQLEKSHRSYARGRLLRLLSPGPQRVTPACALALPAPQQTQAACGGCPLMATTRAAQLATKQAWVTRALRQLSVEVRAILAPAAPLGYRQRARVVIRGGRPSFAAAGSHRGATPTTCPVLEPRLSQVIFERSQALWPMLGEGGVLSGLAGWHDGKEAVHLALAPLGPGVPDSAALRRRLEVLLRAGDIAGASLQTGRASAGPLVIGAPHIAAVPPSDAAELGPLWAAASGFAQACLAGHTLLPRLVAAAARPATDDGPPRQLSQVLELYSGSGNLSRALLPLTAELICVEGDAAAVARARAALRAQPRLYAEPVAPVLRRLRAAGERPAVVVLDPPRAGAAEAMPLIADLAPQRVVYVSCDVMTLARDLALLATSGYALRYVQPLDLMPHTAELECLAVCEAVATGKS